MAKHTPGEWKHWSHGDIRVIRDESGSRICHFDYLTWSGRRPDDEVKANANLIAAAPDLLEACKAALNMVETDLGPPNWDILRAAIAKAEGND